MTEVDLVRVASVAAAECVRQQVGLYGLSWLIQGHLYAWEHFEQMGVVRPESFHMRQLAAKVEPINASSFRNQPVTFRDGGSAAHHSIVPGVVVRMWAALDEDTDPGEFVKAFLDVHPFTDGNGRTAWVLWNWLRGTLNHPDPLPDFYGPREDS